MGEFFDQMGRPFLACLVLTGIHVYLGIHVVARKVIFVDLALAQIAALGTAVGIVLGGYSGDHDPGMLFAYSFAFSCLGAGVLTVTRTRTERVPHEAIIGIVYAVAFAAAFLVLSRSATGPEELRRNLEGDILLVSDGKIKLTAALYAAVALLHVALRKPFVALSFAPETLPPSRLPYYDFLFYLSFAFVITSSVAMAGVFLVFSYLVIPAVGAMLLAERIRTRLLIGWAGSAALSLAGCWISQKSGLPTSPTIVCLLGAALAAIGVGRRIVQSEDRPRTLARIAGATAMLAVFGAGIKMMSKPTEDPYERAGHQIHSAESAEQIAAIGTFARHPERRTEWVEAVREVSDSPHAQVRRAALALLGREALVARLGDGDAERRLEAVELLKERGEAEAAGFLMKAAAVEPEEDVRIEMYHVVLELGSPEAIGPLIGMLEAPGVAPHWREHAHHLLEAHLEEPVEDAAKLRVWYERHKGRLTAKGRKFVPSE